MPRLREAGDSALLLQFDERIDEAVNARAVATATRLRDAGLAGVRDVVATFRSVAVHFDPLRTDVARVTAALEEASSGGAPAGPGRTVEIPVAYGGESGPDLDVVAAFGRVTPAEVVARHCERSYRVFMVGFLPGFAYLGSVDAAIAAPRRATPRMKVAAGSVGIAGRQTGVYPRESPGGWQIIGRTDARLFDLSRTPAALLAPGDMVRFVPVGSVDADAAPAARAPAPHGRAARPSARVVTIVQPGLMTTVQDAGRWGHQHEGVPVCGAMDGAALRLANVAVGNPPEAAALEVTLSGLELRTEQPGLVAIAGADLGAEVNGQPVPLQSPLACAAGTVLRFARRTEGTRAYVAFDGGIAVGACLGSLSTDLTSGFGGVEGRRLRAGDCLPLGPPATPGASTHRPAVARASRHSVAAGGVRVRVLPGPHDDWFAADALARLPRVRFSVSPASNRMGYRLTAPERIPRSVDREMISDATFPGALQVPPSGEPILLMADRQVTGGYPIIATVITADLPLVGQLAPGDWIEFEPCTKEVALAALTDQRAGWSLGG